MTDFIPEWQGTPKATMTLRMVLEMRSGLKKQEYAGAEVADPENILNRAYLGTHIEDTLIADYPLTDPPGSTYAYSQANGDLVAIVVERATGRRYAEFLSRELIQPTGGRGGTVWVDREGGLAHSGCCTMLPAETWLRMGILLLNDGLWNTKRLLPEGFVAEIRRGSMQNPYYGAGIYPAGVYTPRRPPHNPLQGEPFEAEDLYMLDGNANQVLYVIPSAKLVILRMGTRPPSSPEWDNAVLPNLLLRGLTSMPGEIHPRPQATAAP